MKRLHGADAQTTEARTTHGAPELQPDLAPVTATASGKAIIVGEHAVVYGARAVAMPVHSMQMSVRLTPTTRHDKTGAPALRVTLGGRTVTAHLRGVVDDAFVALGIDPFPLDLEGHSTVLIGAGLGSSASLCIVVLKALAEAAGITLSRRELAAAGNRLEKRFHGNPSGLDTAVVAMGRVISFVKGGTPQDVPVAPLAGGRSWRFALLDSGARSSTLAMIQIAAPYFQGDAGQARLAGFDALADAVTRGLATGERALVADAMNQAGVWLAEAGVVNDPIRELMDAARAAGCPAAKPTGAGGGGCVMALLDEADAERQLQVLKERLGGARVYGVELP